VEVSETHLFLIFGEAGKIRKGYRLKNFSAACHGGTLV
jgi:hypothetical protein